MTRLRTIALCTALLAATTATAADRGFYFGGLAGQASYDFEPISLPRYAEPTGPVLGPSLALPVGSTFATYFPENTPKWRPEYDDSSNTFGVFAGYRIVRYAAVEFGYQDLGTLKESLDGRALLFQPIGSPTTFVPIKYRQELQTGGPSISGLGILPILENWSVYARAGVFFGSSKYQASIGKGSEQDITRASESLLFGAGTQFDFGAHWSVRADFQRFDNVGDSLGSGRSDIDSLSLAVIFRL